MRWLMAGALSSLLALAGCTNMMSYSVSEATLERHVKQAVVDFDREQLRAGSPLALELDTTNVTLGPQGRNVIRLDVAGQVSLTAFASRLPADIALSLEGTPYYDSVERAVYLRRLQLLDSHIDAPGLPVDLLPVSQLVARVVAQVLESMPVYRLDDAGWSQRTLARHMALHVETGRLVFEPAR